MPVRRINGFAEPDVKPKAGRSRAPANDRVGETKRSATNLALRLLEELAKRHNIRVSEDERWGIEEPATQAQRDHAWASVAQCLRRTGAMGNPIMTGRDGQMVDSETFLQTFHKTSSPAAG